MEKKKAIKYFERASKGISDALIELAFIEMETNPQKANEILTKAEELNNPLAMYLKATLLQTGNGVEKNLKEAEKLFIKSSDGLKKISEKMPRTRSVIFSLQFYANLLFHGLTNEKISDKSKASQMMKEAADLGNAECDFFFYSYFICFILFFILILFIFYFCFNFIIFIAAYIYANWIDKEMIPENCPPMEESVKYYTKAVMGGYPAAFLDLANCYSTGRGVEKDFKKSNDLLFFASEKGSV